MRKSQQGSAFRILQMLFVVLLFSVGLNAQVTVGGHKEPQKYSILEIVSGGKGGLRLPQLTNNERESLTDSSFKSDLLSRGLAIFNVDTQCYEYWNGIRWVSLCEGNSLMTLSPDPCLNVAADATGCGHEFKVTDTDCKNGPFHFAIVAGGEYASLTDEDHVNGTFKIAFLPNNTIRIRSVVVRIISSCTGLYKDYLFTQLGESCNPVLGEAPSITSVPSGRNISLCSGGAVYLSVPASTPNLSELIWTRNNIEIARGVNNIVATQPGVYDVWMGIVGCGQKVGNSVTVDKNGSGALAPLDIIVKGNNGLVCDIGGTTQLIAKAPAVGKVRWFKDGQLQSETYPNNLVNAGIGKWFAVVTDGTCWSMPSEDVYVRKDPSNGNPVGQPHIRVNGQTNPANYSFCAGGSALLEVDNVDPLVAKYTWYIDNTEVGTGTSVLYNIPKSSNGKFILRLRAEGTGCSAESMVEKQISATPAPGAPSISGNDVLCGGSVTLTANTIVPFPVYKWYYGSINDSEATIPLPQTGQSITVNAEGIYQVVVMDGQCVSQKSIIKKITLSDFTSISWAQKVDNANFNTYKVFQVSGTNAPVNYRWTITNASPATATGTTVGVNFPASGVSSQIVVSAENSCGPALNVLDHTVTLNNECAAPLITVPAADTSLDAVTGVNASLSVMVANTVNPTYQWYKDGVVINTVTEPTAATATYTFKPLSGGSSTYYCVVTNNCTGGATKSAISNKYTVNTKVIPADVGSATLSGKSCFDLAVGNNGGSCAPLSSRQSQKVDFTQSSTNTQAYIFKLLSGTGTNLRFLVVENNGADGTASDGTGKIIEAQPTETYSTLNTINNYSVILKFKGSLNQDAKDASMYSSTKKPFKATLYAIYNNGTKDVAIKYEIRIQDCACCGASTKSGIWLSIACHNLGADDSLNPFVANKGLIGNYYQWGSNIVAAYAPSHQYFPDAINGSWNTATITAANAWNTGTETTPKKTSSDPCPAGWRLPTKSEWQSIHVGMQQYWNPATFGWNASSNTFKNGVNVGKTLYLPAAGSRANNNGGLSKRDFDGIYWSSTSFADYQAYALYFSESTVVSDQAFSKTTGVSIRCIEE